MSHIRKTIREILQHVVLPLGVSRAATLAQLVFDRPPFPFVQGPVKTRLQLGKKRANARREFELQLGINRLGREAKRRRIGETGYPLILKQDTQSVVPTILLHAKNTGRGR